MNKLIKVLLGIIIILVLSLATIFYLDYRQEEAQKEFLRTTVNQGTEAIKNQDWPKAYELFTKAYEADPDSSEAIYGLYLSSMELKYYEQTKNLFNSLSDANRQKQGANAYKIAITFANQKGETTLVNKWLKEALGLFPNDNLFKNMQNGIFPEIRADQPIDWAEIETKADLTALKQTIKPYIDNEDWSALEPIIKESIEKGKYDEEIIGILAKVYINQNRFDDYQNLHKTYSQKGFDEKIFPNYEGNTQANIQNGGQAVIVDNYVYYPHYANYELSRWELANVQDMTHWQRQDFEPETINGVHLAYLNHRDGILYGQDTTSQKIMQYDLNSKEIKPLYEGQADQIYLFGSYIYFRDLQDKNKLKRLDLQTNAVTDIINTKIKSYCLLSDSVYFIDVDADMKVKRQNLKTGESETVVNTRTDEIAINAENLFYINAEDQNRIYIADFNGSNSRQLLKVENCNNLHIDGKNLYFNNFYVQKLNLQTGAVTQVCNFSGNKITTIADKLLILNEMSDWFKVLADPNGQKVYQVDPLT